VSSIEAAFILHMTTLAIAMLAMRALWKAPDWCIKVLDLLEAIRRYRR